VDTLRPTLLLAFAVALLSACAEQSLPPLAAPAAPTASSEGPIVVLGDTQRTLGAESLFLGREQNEAERRALIDKIAAEERPAFVVHLGDMVAVGDSAEEWQYFDRLISPLRARHIPVFPVFGNHDLWGERRVAVRRARQRFPELARGGSYARRYRGLGLVWLNSNLDGSLGVRQAAWLEEVLRLLDADASTCAVLLFMHHPAFTNGKHRHGEPYVVQQLLPRFLAAKKAVVLLSGHVHGYERFSSADGREFVVSGGGGGPRVKYEVGREAFPAPAYLTDTGEPRAFNYVVIESEPTRLRFTVKCVPQGAACPDGILDRFFVEYPQGSGSPLGA
jgi:hypothetical protein